MTDIDLACLDQLIATVSDSCGFQIHPERAVFAGTCATCRARLDQHHGR